MTDYATKEGWANNLGAHFLPDNPTQQVVAQEWAVTTLQRGRPAGSELPTCQHGTRSTPKLDRHQRLKRHSGMTQKVDHARHTAPRPPYFTSEPTHGMSGAEGKGNK